MKILKLLLDVSPQLEMSVRTLCEYAILQESPKKKIAWRHVAGPRQPLHGTMLPNPLPKSCIKILVDDEGIMGWCAIVHFNRLNTNTTTLNTVVHDSSIEMPILAHVVSNSNFCFVVFSIQSQANPGVV